MLLSVSFCLVYFIPLHPLTPPSSCSSGLTRVSYQVASRTHLDEALAALVNLPQLKTLELIVKNFTLCSDQLRVIGQ